MITLTLISPPLTPPLSLKPSLTPISTRSYNQLKQSRRTLRNGECRAEFSGDAPVAVAIGACILNSLIFPVNYTPDDDDDDEVESLIDSTDKRFAVMGIISFIPYFNWMSWVFAWLDTGKQRYAVYAIVYLAPYLRSNLSISPEESWLPIASILLCIAHIQLEVSIKNGDLQGFQIFGKAAKSLSSMTQKRKDKISQQEDRREDFRNLPSGKDGYRNEIRDWEDSQKPHEDGEILNEDEETDGWGKH